jgi:hypothetical protein
MTTAMAAAVGGLALAYSAIDRVIASTSVRPASAATI